MYGSRSGLAFCVHVRGVRWSSLVRVSRVSGCTGVGSVGGLVILEMRVLE